jgi:hypothetical protein
MIYFDRATKIQPGSADSEKTDLERVKKSLIQIYVTLTNMTQFENGSKSSESIMKMPQWLYMSQVKTKMKCTCFFAI